MLASASSMASSRNAAVKTTPPHGTDLLVATRLWNALRLKFFCVRRFQMSSSALLRIGSPMRMFSPTFGVALKQPASGLITAMEPVMRAQRRQLGRARQWQCRVAGYRPTSCLAGPGRSGPLPSQASVVQRTRTACAHLWLIQRRSVAAVP